MLRGSGELQADVLGIGRAVMADKAATRHVVPSIDLSGSGYRAGDLMVRWSDNTVPLGWHPVPIIVTGGGQGPVALLIAGVHGDEFEGPSAILRVINRLSPDDMNGTVIALPCLNSPAVRESSRTSPLDGLNMNRVFPGNPTGGPTELIADYVESVLVPRCSMIIDLHSGGKASVFSACSLVTRTSNRSLYEAGLTLARHMGLPTIWVLGDFNDDRSVNSAALRAGIPMIATELGGGGGCDPYLVTLAEQGILNCLAHAGIIDRQSGMTVPPVNRMVEIHDMSINLYSPGRGLFDRYLDAGTFVEEDQIAGRFYRVEESMYEPEIIRFPRTGFLLAHTNRGMVGKGDMLYMVANPVES